MKINFLSINQAQELFRIPDSYARNLPLSNLTMVNPKNPTLTGYQKILLSSFDHFSKKEEQAIEKIADEFLSKLDLEINLIKTKGTHRLDITQTRNNSILVTHGHLGTSTLVHEVYHILSRKYKNLTPTLSRIWGFQQVENQQIKHPDFLLNPDAENINFSIKVIENQTKKEYEVTPFVIKGLQAGLKVLNEDHYLKENKTNYSNLIQNTSYIAHPEEICAEHFSLAVVGHCLFERSPLDFKVIELYKSILNLELTKLGILL